MIEAIFRFVAERIPGSHARWALRKRPLGIDESHFNLTAVPLIAQLVPSGRVLTAVAINVGLRRHERKMHRRMGQVPKERLLRRLGFVNRFESPLGDQVWTVPILA